MLSFPFVLRDLADGAYVQTHVQRLAQQREEESEEERAEDDTIPLLELDKVGRAYSSSKWRISKVFTEIVSIGKWVHLCIFRRTQNRIVIRRHHGTPREVK